MARLAWAVSAMTLNCGNGAEPSAVPVELNAARVRRRARDVHHHPVRGAHHHARQQHPDGSSSAISGPAARQNRASITSVGTGSR